MNENYVYATLALNGLEHVLLNNVSSKIGPHRISRISETRKSVHGFA